MLIQNLQRRGIWYKRLGLELEILTWHAWIRSEYTKLSRNKNISANINFLRSEQQIYIYNFFITTLRTPKLKGSSHAQHTNIKKKDI